MTSETHSQLQIFALVATLLAWWLGTALVLRIVRLKRGRTQAFAVLSVVAVGALLVLPLLSDRGDPTAALIGFLCGMTIWAWNEAAFLMGRVVGPRIKPCEPGCGGFPHAIHAFRAISYHEAALVGCGALLFWLSGSKTNQTAFLTFALLWLMRVSAKLNLHLGVRNLAENWLPRELEHLRPFLRRRKMNALFPFSVAAATVATVALTNAALDSNASEFERTRDAALAVLACLGLLEHWLLVLPVDPTWLWRRVSGEDSR